MIVRIGFGYDMHRLQSGRELWIGGIKIDHEKGLLGHSDADVLIHAICDALLGAANLRDIGFHFPDTAPEFEQIDSKILLAKTLRLVEEKGYSLGFQANFLIDEYFRSFIFQTSIQFFQRIHFHIETFVASAC